MDKKTLSPFVHRGRVVPLSGPPSSSSSGYVLSNDDELFLEQQVHEGYMMEGAQHPVFFVDIDRAIQALLSMDIDARLRVYRRESNGADYIRTRRILQLVEVNGYETMFTVQWNEDTP